MSLANMTHQRDLPIGPGLQPLSLEESQKLQDGCSLEMAGGDNGDLMVDLIPTPPPFFFFFGGGVKKKMQFFFFSTFNVT